MKVDLYRTPSTMSGTFGILCINDIPACVTCEDPWRENMRQVSCIPAGTYQCGKFSGTRYTNVWEVKSVPNRTAILIHAGNTMDDTQGCILVGLAFGTLNGKPAVVNSNMALDMLRKRLPDTFTLTIHGKEPHGNAL